MCRFPQRNIKKKDFPQRKVSSTMLTRVNNFRLSMGKPDTTRKDKQKSDKKE